MTYSFILTGHIVPYVRMTRRGKWVNERAKLYLASQEALAWQMKQTMSENDLPMLPERTPLQVSILITVSKRLHCSDLDNQVKAVLDAAQGVVFKNDLWIDMINARRSLLLEGEDHCYLKVIGVI
jgi:Holliday junction resolvase RusA-like endonuclease